MHARQFFGEFFFNQLIIESPFQIAHCPNARAGGMFSCRPVNRSSANDSNNRGHTINKAKERSQKAAQCSWGLSKQNVLCCVAFEGQSSKTISFKFEGFERSLAIVSKLAKDQFAVNQILVGQFLDCRQRKEEEKSMHLHP